MVLALWCSAIGLLTSAYGSPPKLPLSIYVRLDFLRRPYQAPLNRLTH
jgi:hypothetical protein